MPFHPASSDLVQYIQRTIPDLVDPIESIQWLAWEPGDALPDGMRLIHDELFILALQLSIVDKDISEQEVDVWRDVHRVFEDSDDDDILPSRTLRDIYRKLVREKPGYYGQLSRLATVGFLEIYDDQHGTDYAYKAKALFFRFARTLVNADGKATQDEEIALTNLQMLLYAPTNEVMYSLAEETQVYQHELTDLEEMPSLDESLNHLNSLVGLDTVKSDVIQLVNFLRVQQMRQARGMATVPVSRHLVFYGNPGTGKTTVARILAQVYKSLKVISRGHLVETDRSGLVAGYVGQTALKVREVVTQALGGVLFIDEAYALTVDGQDFGQEAIDTLIKLMEDHRDDLIVIVAGYPDKMSKFLASNPGLKSRFNKYFNFEDYSPLQLIEIFGVFCSNSGFRLSSEARKQLYAIFHALHGVRDFTFGNARLARNLFEQTINNQANRIISLPSIDEDTLSTIEAVDIPGEVQILSHTNMTS